MKCLKILLAVLSLAAILFAEHSMARSQELTPTATPIPNSAGQAEVVFMRHSFAGSAIKATLYEVIEKETIFIGIIENKETLTYKTSPGKHIFMVVSEAADFLEADILADHTYYSIITPRMGAWKARFSLWPIRNDGTTEFNTQSPDFKKWLADSKPADKNEKDKDWYAKNKDSVAAKQADYISVWKKKSPEDIEERTLKPNDGILQPSN